jgi:L-threonylcarbamoyladenylate synthase
MLRELTLLEAGRMVDAGAVLAYPTETVWGIGGKAIDKEVVARVLACKGIASARAMPVLASCTIGAVSVVPVPVRESMRVLAGEFWPGGLTIAVPVEDPYLAPMAAEDGTVGLRVSANPVATFLALQAGGFLVSTSANLTGQPPPSTAQEISQGLLDRLDGVVGMEHVAKGLPSTVIKWRDGLWEIIREGAVPAASLARLVRLVGA